MKDNIKTDYSYFDQPCVFPTVYDELRTLAAGRFGHQSIVLEVCRPMFKDEQNVKLERFPPEFLAVMLATAINRHLDNTGEKDFSSRVGASKKGHNTLKRVDNFLQGPKVKWFLSKIGINVGDHKIAKQTYTRNSDIDLFPVPNEDDTQLIKQLLIKFDKNSNEWADAISTHSHSYPMGKEDVLVDTMINISNAKGVYNIKIKRANNNRSITYQKNEGFYQNNLEKRMFILCESDYRESLTYNHPKHKNGIFAVSLLADSLRSIKRYSSRETTSIDSENEKDGVNYYTNKTIEKTHFIIKSLKKGGFISIGYDNTTNSKVLTWQYKKLLTDYKERNKDMMDQYTSDAIDRLSNDASLNDVINELQHSPNRFIKTHLDSLKDVKDICDTVVSTTFDSTENRVLKHDVGVTRSQAGDPNSKYLQDVHTDSYKRTYDFFGECISSRETLHYGIYEICQRTANNVNEVITNLGEIKSHVESMKVYPDPATDRDFAAKHLKNFLSNLETTYSNNNNVTDLIANINSSISLKPKY